MRQVLCISPNCSEEVSGVRFTKMSGGMVSDPIDDAIANRFLSIPGYLPYEPEDVTPPSVTVDRLVEGDGDGGSDGTDGDGADQKDDASKSAVGGEVKDVQTSDKKDKKDKKKTN